MELTCTVAVIGLLAAAAMMSFGHDTVNTTDTDGFVRRVVLDLRQARRAAIATGDDHYVRFNRTSGSVVGYDLMRVTSGGDVQVQPATALPTDSTVTTGSDTWRFDFSGALTTSGASSTIQVDGATYAWTATVYHATGAVRTAKVAQP